MTSENKTARPSIINQAQMITELKRLFGEKIQLTGSYYFEAATPISDLDFFISTENHKRDVLEALGFVLLIRGSAYKDSLTKLVWRHDALCIDIQVVEDFDLKRITQAVMKELGITRPTTGDWEAHFQAVRTILTFLKPGEVV